MVPTSMIESSMIKAEALRLGFFAAGIARATRVDEAAERDYREWLAMNGHASMAYLAGNLEKRFDPRLLVEGVTSIVCVALNYAPAERFPEGELKIASYALGKDYHDVVKARLHQLAETIGAKDYRVFCDSAPVLERYWAEQSGLGWVGKSGLLVVPHAGNRFFLGELFLVEEVDHYDTPMANRCGNCTKCIDACPTGALRQSRFDAELCLSYQTIENRGTLSPLAMAKMGDMFYGCDRCVNACPWNSFSSPTAVAELKANPELMAMTRQRWANLTDDDYKRLFKGSAVKRAKFAQLKRNIEAALTIDSLRFDS